MNRKRALRRRAIAAILLLLSVGMLTLFFREPANGVVHRAQDVGMRIVRPLQAGTARVTKPFRDAWNWFGDLFPPRREQASAEGGHAAASGGGATLLALQAENDQLRGLLVYNSGQIFPRGERSGDGARDRALDERLVLDGDHRRGQQHGVKLYDAVVNDQGLVGRVSA